MSFQNPLRNEKSAHIYFDSLKNPRALTAIIFIHGLAGSRRYWGEDYKALSKQHSLYFIDLLGFGLSAKPNLDYTLETHTGALKKFIDENVQEKSIILVGFSLGAIIALALSSKLGNRLKRVYLISLPYFRTEDEAREHFRLNITPSYFVVNSFWTKLTCTLVCYLGGPITRTVAPLFLPKLPAQTASDGFLHTYNSYITTLTNVIYKQDIPKLLSGLDVSKITLIHGGKDQTSPIENIKSLAKKYKLDLIILQSGNHQLPVEAKDQLIMIIKQQLG